MRTILLILLPFLFSGLSFGQDKNQMMKKDSLELHGQVPDKEDRNNNFYDNETTYHLNTGKLEIAGEIANPGFVDFSLLPKRSVIVKETVLNPDGSNSFVGAYRYDGYSLFDILNESVLKKKNAELFRPIIDLYVEIENADGEKVILSWGEIYYPNNLHNIIIATDVMRIVPSKTKELWPLPEVSKLIVGNDLITERNIKNPVKITVKSYEKQFAVNRDIKPLYSEKVDLYIADQKSKLDESEFTKMHSETLHTIFYGRGRGIHTTQPFTGYDLQEVFENKITFTKENIRKCLIAIVGADGYRSVYTYSEIVNRNDQAEILLIPCKEEKDGGAFRIFPSCDFFSDRAVKAVTELRITNNE